MNRVTVKPELLHWACERSGFGVDALVHRFPKLLNWERGEVSPTLKQLESFAKATHTPVGYLFLPEPPVERVPIPDFRTVVKEQIGRPSPDLLDTIYVCQQRQEWYRDFARAMGEQPLAFVGSVQVDDDVLRTAALIRQAIGFDVEERRRLPTWTDALRRFIEQADVLGVLVMVSGVVGSNNRRKLDPQEFRGFALADDLAPLVFINGADTKAAQMFTLAHELAHIWLGESAVSDAQASLVPDHKVERWCSQVAAELLVPRDAFRAEYNRSAEPRAEANRLAKRFKVSIAELEFLRTIPKGSGGDFYLTLGARASKRFARALVISTLEGRPSFTEAFRLLGFKKMATFRDLGHSFGQERSVFAQQQRTTNMDMVC